MRKPYTIIIAVVILAILIYLLVPRPPIVEVAEVVRGDLNAVLSTTGVVESELADVAPRIVSRIDRLLVQEGQMVRRVQPLALLDRSELLAQVEEARAALSAARQDLARARQAVELQSNQSSAAISHAEAALRASEAQLADLQKGARTQEIEQARSAVNQAKSETVQARSDLERAETLYGRGAIPAQQLDAARTTADVAKSRLRAAEEQLDLLREGPRPDAVKVAKAQVAAAKAGLAEARTSRDLIRMREREAEIAASQVRRAEAVLRAAEAQLGYAVVRSPFNGLVARKHLEVGEVAGPQSPIFTLANLGHIWVSAEVDEEDVGAVGVGQ
jgi:multidrug resistance efflux pump